MGPARWSAESLFYTGFAVAIAAAVVLGFARLTGRWCIASSAPATTDGSLTPQRRHRIELHRPAGGQIGASSTTAPSVRGTTTNVPG
jgi:hypothetical protein